MDIIKKKIQLPKGGVLEIDLTEQFLNVVCAHFELDNKLNITEAHIRMFVWGAFKSAIDKIDIA